MSANGTLASYQAQWRDALESLPSNPDKIPSFFFAHGSPFLMLPENETRFPRGIVEWQGPTGPLATFLKDFGPALLRKYKPKGIVVFSAHWETLGARLVTDYGDENPLLYDYSGFAPEMYKLKFKSKGDARLSQRVVQLYKDVGRVSVCCVLILILVGRIFCTYNDEARSTGPRRARLFRTWSGSWSIPAIQADVWGRVERCPRRSSHDRLEHEAR